MSVMKPGVSSSAPPKITSTPSSTSRAGGRAAWSASLKRRHAIRPCERISIAPSTESAIRIAIVHQTPICWPTWMITASSAIGTTMKRNSRNGSISPPYVTTSRLRGFERHGGLAVEPDEPDQRPHLRLRRPQQQRAPLGAEALGEHGEVDHQRRVGEAQLGQIHADVARRVQRRGQRAPAQAGRRPVLIPLDEQGHLL